MNIFQTTGDSLISVIVPCFNYARYLEQCVASLAQQSYSHWECVIVDDGSTDETSAVCARLSRADARVRCVRQEQRGLSAARNAGIGRAKGGFIQFLDADDLLEPDKLRNQVEFLAANPEVDIVLGEAAFFDDGEPARLRSRRRDGGLGTTRRIDGQGATVLAELVLANICVVHAALVRRAVVDAVGAFDETLAAHEDWDFWLRSASRGMRFRFFSVGRDRALVREHGASMTAAVERMLRTAITIRERLQERLPAALAGENAVRLADLRSRLGILLLGTGRVKEGWSLYLQAVRSAHVGAKAVLRPVLLVPGVQQALGFARRIRSAATS